MVTTRTSLLMQIKDRQNTKAWSEFHDIYAPLIYHYARSRGLGHEDAEDVRARCYEALTKQIAEFDYDRQKGGFQAWLRTIVDRRVVDLFRRRRECQADSHELASQHANMPSAEQIWQEQWRQQHLVFCVEQARHSVPDSTYEVFRMLMNEGASVQFVCEKLNLNANQVYKAKAKMLEQVRQVMKSVFPEEFED